MCYCPTPTLHLNLSLTGDGAFLLSPQKTHTVWFISILNYGDTENVLINHHLLVIPMSYPCHYTNLCPHKPHKHAHTYTHTHTHTHTHQVQSLLLHSCQKHSAAFASALFSKNDPYPVQQRKYEEHKNCGIAGSCFILSFQSSLHRQITSHSH